MFVQNCGIDFGQELLMPDSKEDRRRAGRKKEKAKKNDDKNDDASDELTEGAASFNRKYYSVKCDVCSTQVAVYDQDEVYHFFNVLASHS